MLARILGRISLSLLAILLMLLIGEAAFRWVPMLGLDGDRFNAATRSAADPALVWELDPESPLVNSDGLRDRDYTVEKAADTYRIVAVGDSITYGFSIPLEDTYVKQLEDLLNAGDMERQYEVINLGIGGYNTSQELHRYQSKGRKYQPDLILIGYALNDIEPPSTVLAVVKWLEERENRWYYRSKLTKWFLDRLEAPPIDAAGGPGGPVLAHEDPEKWHVVKKAFGNFARIGKEDGVPVVLVIFPLLEDLDDYRYRPLHAKVSGEATRQGLLVLDLLEDFRGHETGEMRRVQSDVWHPSPEGHAVAAEAIHDFLQPETGANGQPPVDEDESRSAAISDRMPDEAAHDSGGGL